MRFIFGIIPALVLALLVSCSLSSCSIIGKLAAKAKSKKNKGKQTQTAKVETIGVIEMVNPEQKYVLVRCDAPPAFSAGTELYSVDALGAEAKLLVTPEHKGYYLTADIKSGAPHVANLVIRKHSAPEPPKTAAATATATAASPAAAAALPPPATTPAPAVEPPLPQAAPTPAAATPTPTLEPVVR